MQQQPCRPGDVTLEWQPAAELWSSAQAWQLTCKGRRGQAELLGQSHDSAAGVAAAGVHAHAGSWTIVGEAVPVPMVSGPS